MTPPLGPVIQSPINTTYNDTNVNLNYTITEGDQCRYELDGSNTTLANCQNTTMSGLTESSHYVKVWVNDSVDNWNASATLYFIVDVTSPQVTLNLPQNTTYNYNVSLPLNFTVIENNTETCWYKLDSDSNVSLTT